MPLIEASELNPTGCVVAYSLYENDARRWSAPKAEMSMRSSITTGARGYRVLAVVCALAAASAGRLVAQGSPSTSTGGHSMSEYKKPTESELKQKLTPIQYQVTQHEGTERPFQNEYWNNHEAGIYVDVVSGEPLFSSLDKYESGTGWPSFTKPLVPENIKTKTDRSLFMTRTEVRSAHADSHLGHLFDDGPKPTGQRYCMNSASMRFIPVSKLAAEGYGEYVKLFETANKK
jgi:peptide-methionine (R)-S-oxide reductase